MLSNNYKKALVTGASSGIGESVVKLLTKNNIEVFALARRREKLEKLSNSSGCKIIEMDIRNFKEIEKLKDHEFDILINNAGVGRGFDKIFNTKAEDINITIDTNVKAFLQVLRCVIPSMVRKKRGHVINVGSIAGLYPLSSSVYGGSKGAVHMINQNLRLELSGTGIRCTEINPGRVDTEFFDIAFDNEEDKKRMKTGLTLLKPDDIAESILYAINTPAHVNISLIELTPTEQAPGGVVIKKIE